MIEAPKKNPPPKEISNLSYLYVLSKKQKKKKSHFFSAQSAVLFLKVGLHVFLSVILLKAQGLFINAPAGSLFLS